MKASITSRQTVALMTISRLALAISIMPTINIRPYNQDIWIIVLLSIIYTHIMMAPLLFLANKFKDSTMIGYLEVIHGKTIGKIVGFLYGLYFLANAFNSSTVQSELITTSILTDTSESLIVIAMMATCIYAVSRGCETVLRASEVLAPIALSLIVLLMLFGINNFQYYLLLPIFADSTFLDINLGAIELSTYYSEIFILTMLIPYLEDKEDINKIFTKSAIYSLGLLSIIVIVCQISLGVEHMKHSNFPFLIYVRSIDIFEIVERIDSIAVMGWLITSFVRVGAFLLFSVEAFREILNKDNKEKIILPILGLILTIMTLWIINTRSVVIYRSDLNMIRTISFIIFVIVIPLITCILYFIRRKSIESKNNI